jgi:hypothetical protein
MPVSLTDEIPGEPIAAARNGAEPAPAVPLCRAGRFVPGLPAPAAEAKMSILADSSTNRIATGACAALALVLAAPAFGQPEQDRSALFAAEALRICVDTAASAAPVRQLAAAEKWTAIDPASAPVKSKFTLGGKKRSQDKVFQRAAAWTFEKNGLAVTVGLFDAPGEPRVRQCELMARDLDFAAVERGLKADPRVTGGEDMGLPMRMFSVKDPQLRLSYLASDTGTRMLHSISVN